MQPEDKLGFAGWDAMGMGRLVWVDQTAAKITLFRLKKANFAWGGVGIGG